MLIIIKPRTNNHLRSVSILTNLVGCFCRKPPSTFCPVTARWKCYRNQKNGAVFCTNGKRLAIQQGAHLVLEWVAVIDFRFVARSDGKHFPLHYWWWDVGCRFGVAWKAGPWQTALTNDKSILLSEGLIGGILKLSWRHFDSPYGYWRQARSQGEGGGRAFFGC